MNSIAMGQRGQPTLPNASTCATVRSGVDILSGGFAIVDHRHDSPSMAEKKVVDETLIVSALVVVDASRRRHPPLHNWLSFFQWNWHHISSGGFNSGTLIVRRSPL